VSIAASVSNDRGLRAVSVFLYWPLASRGIGAAIVRRFAKGGGKVAFTYAGSKDAAEALAAETGAEAIRTDSADRDALITTVASLGALDILVLVAGGDGSRLPTANALGGARYQSRKMAETGSKLHG
jgi:NAD(P)-dependent dehydrogenase (short-subunit alcohol dehydrogenase family)